MPMVFKLLWPKARTMFRPGKSSAGEQSWFAILFFVSLGLLFWMGIYRGSTWLCLKCLALEDIGELLLRKILSMAFLTFFSILLFSNLVTSFSTLFLSDDLNLLNTAPVSLGQMYVARFLETLFHASWMVLIFGTPFLLAYGQTFKAKGIYYLQLLLVMIPFTVIPCALAVVVALLLATLFPAHRTRDITIFLSVLGFAVLYLYIRLLQPERFLDPENFSQAIDFLGMLRNPTSAYLPSDWVVSALFPLLTTKATEYKPIYLSALYSTAAAFGAVGWWTFEALYPRAYSQAQVGRKIKAGATVWLDRALTVLTLPFDRLNKVMLQKEFRTFVRNPGQWSQLLLLGAMVVVYIFNFSSLRQLSSIRVQGISAVFAELGIYMFNLVLLGFVTSAVAVRFAFPAVSLEGKSYWLIAQSPLSMKQFLRSKFWSIFLPLLILAQLLSILTNVFIRSSMFLTAMSSITVLLMTVGITGMGIGMGAMYPRFEVENPAKIASGFGGVLYMICCIVWVAVLLLMELLPLRHIFWSRIRKLPLTGSQMLQVLVVGVLALALTWAVYSIPMKLGARALDNRR